jgi:hypothetical protein
MSPIVFDSGWSHKYFTCINRQLQASIFHLIRDPWSTWAAMSFQPRARFSGPCVAIDRRGGVGVSRVHNPLPRCSQGLHRTHSLPFSCIHVFPRSPCRCACGHAWRKPNTKGASEAVGNEAESPARTLHCTHTQPSPPPAEGTQRHATPTCMRAAEARRGSR